MLLHIVYSLLAIIGLMLGANIVILYSQKISKKMNISEFFIGLTLFSVITSLPEIIAHIIASIDILKKPLISGTLSGIVLGTNIGSNIIQITLITGIVGLFGKLICDNKFLKRDYIFMLFSILLLFFFSLTGHFISRIEGFVLIIMYIIYVARLTKAERITTKRAGIAKELILILVGFVMLLFSANQILNESVLFSKYFGISGTFIGTMIIGVITALPELTTSIIALIKKSPHFSLGTLVGSNITNPLLAVGIGALISGYKVSSSLLYFDLPFWFLISFIGFFLFWYGKYLSKKQALVLISGYLLYAALNIAFFR